MEQTNVEEPSSISKPKVNQLQKVTPTLTAFLLAKKPLIIVGVLLGFILFGVGGYMIGLQKANLEETSGSSAGNISNTISPTPQLTNIPSQPTMVQAHMSVVIKENEQDNTKSDIYLKDDSGNETYFISLSDIYRNHYHNAEYHNGNLYVIHRTGGDRGYQNNPNWTDSLWRYGQDKQGVQLYAVRGLDFRVSDDESFITIITNESFIVLNNDGSELKSFPASEVISNPESSPMFGFLSWDDKSVWLDNTFGPSLTGLAHVDLVSFTVNTYDLSGLPSGPEYSLNPAKRLIAFSNYPALFDVDSAEDYEQSGSKVNLIVYDLNDKSQQTISTSITKRFKPKWVDGNTLEYNNPNGEGRLTTQI